MPFPYLRQVERFVAVADEGSIQAAARRMNLSQPSMTRAIASIEESFGTPLFERGSRGVKLTPTGELLYARSLIILSEGSLVREQIADLVLGRAGLLRISAGTAWGYCYMPAIIAELQERYPQLRVELDVGMTSLALPRLYAGELDLVVGSLDDAPPPPDGAVVEAILPIRFAAACGASHPLARRDDIDLADLVGLPLVIYKDDQHLISRVLARLGTSREEGPNIAVKTQSLLSAMELLRTGRYLIFMAEPFLHQFAGRHIKILELRTPLPSFRSGIIYRQTLSHTEPFSLLLHKIRALGR
ncbi:MAG: LysR family transcriptional regulator [Pseudomonadota bacterium]